MTIKIVNKNNINNISEKGMLPFQLKILNKNSWLSEMLLVLNGIHVNRTNK